MTWTWAQLLVTNAVERRNRLKITHKWTRLACWNLATGFDITEDIFGRGVQQWCKISRNDFVTHLRLLPTGAGLSSCFELGSIEVSQLLRQRSINFASKSCAKSLSRTVVTVVLLMSPDQSTTRPADRPVLVYLLFPLVLFDRQMQILTRHRSLPPHRSNESNKEQRPNSFAVLFR